MNKWELARFVIDAKKNIDTLLYIKENQQQLCNLDLNKIIKATYREFYIGCCIVLDKAFPKQKKQLCGENALIKELYYHRDKWASHRDDDYQFKKFDSPDEIINTLKLQLEEVVKVCKQCLPNNITLDYVPHDKILFRVANRINASFETDICMVKYPQGTFHSYNLSEEGRRYFKDFDTENQDRRTADMLGFDYDSNTPKKIVHDIDEIEHQMREERSRVGVYVENGLNSFEGIQNRQDFCIINNVIHNLDMWCTFNSSDIKKIKKLQEIGYFDIFEIPNAKKIFEQDLFQKYCDIMENKDE